MVLDTPRPDGTVDRVLVDVGEPRASATDARPRVQRYVAGNQDVLVQGQTITAEVVNPVLPPRSAAEQFPDGQVEEAVFVRNLNTGETTVERYRDPRDPGETLQEHLEETIREDRGVEPVAETQEPGSVRARARTLREKGASAVGGVRRAGGAAVERGRTLGEGAVSYVDTHAPETKAALLERARKLAGPGKTKKQAAKPKPKGLDALLAGILKSQPAGQKKAGKKPSKSSATRTKDKKLRTIGGGRRKITVYID